MFEMDDSTKQIALAIILVSLLFGFVAGWLVVKRVNSLLPSLIAFALSPLLFICGLFVMFSFSNINEFSDDVGLIILLLSPASVGFGVAGLIVKSFKL
jgi:glucan phosphoethanolaminetransferase (alkaline phosphatase superfamily)